MSDAESVMVREFSLAPPKTSATPQTNAPRLKSSSGSGTEHIEPEGNLERWLAGMVTATGTDNAHLMDILVNQAANAAGTTDDRPEKSRVDLTNAALAELHGIAPRSPLEGMLAVQMVACHNLTLQLVGRANWNQDSQLRAVYAGLAAKLMRAFTAQLETLGRLRGQTTNQVVRVEHVNVAPGGQAVVGVVAGGRGR